VARRQRVQNNEVASNSLNESVTTVSVSGGSVFLKPERQAGPWTSLDASGSLASVTLWLDGAQRTGLRWERLMRLVRLLIWLATLFFAVMLFLPLVRQIIRRLTEVGGSALP
jgi:hypothetical protein